MNDKPQTQHKPNIITALKTNGIKNRHPDYVDGNGCDDFMYLCCP